MMTTQDKDLAGRVLEWCEHHSKTGAGYIVDEATVTELVEDEIANANKDLAVAREMLAAKDAEIAKHAERWGQVDRMREAIDLLTRQRDELAKTLAERDALCEQQTRTINGIPALMQERGAEKARADAAEQLVCEMRGVLRYYATRDFDSRGYSDSQLQAPADAALARTEPAAGRWVSHDVHERTKETWRKRHAELAAERDAAIAAKEAAESKLDVEYQNAQGADLRVEWVRAEQAESREHALGVQVDALQKRLALAMAVAEAARITDCDSDSLPPRLRRLLGVLRGALAALDAVPGDALAAPTVDYREASGGDVERVSVERDDPVLSTVRAATSPLDWSDDDVKGGE